MTQLIWQRPEWPSFSWQSSVLLELLVKVRFTHGKLLAFAPLIETQRGDILLIDSLESPLTKERLIELFGELRRSNLNAGAPPPEKLNAEMKKFLAWWNEPPVGMDGTLRAGVALFWVLIISPFKENNEEIAREICELALAQDEKFAIRLYDIPAQLHQYANEYRKVLENSIKGDGEITEFLMFFLDLLLKSLIAAEMPTQNAINAFRFWKNKNQTDLNMRQRRLLESFSSGEISFVTNRDYVHTNKVSRESAKRDLAELEKLGFITRGNTKGRAIEFSLKK
ncbi:MAG: DUF4172 domain-containing protein [Bdellovibrionaceae bacterium]|nr:DUF4172 domain-containing protein [Bdellovibrio sp.]